jgi:hypothetical protein
LRRVDADEDESLADVLVAGQAGGAGAAPLEGHHRDGVAHRPRVDSRSDLGDPSGHLMTKNSWHGDALIHVPVHDVQVGPADAGKGHVDPDLSRSWGLLSHGGDVDGVTADVAGGPGLGRHDFP